MLLKNEPEITPELVKAHGLKPDEYERFDAADRPDTHPDRAWYRLAMWNEHCSYKSSRIHLRACHPRASA